ncbi:hypothetical protein ABZX88_15575 [Kitasatospora aureofaciens]
MCDRGPALGQRGQGPWAFLASDYALWVTGRVIDATGGAGL